MLSIRSTPVNLRVLFPLKPEGMHLEGQSLNSLTLKEWLQPSIILLAKAVAEL